MTNQTMVSQPESVTVAETFADKSPFVVEFFMVQGIGFRCMAYCDQDGKWRNALSHEELWGDICLLE